MRPLCQALPAQVMTAPTAPTCNTCAFFFDEGLSVDDDALCAHPSGQDAMEKLFGEPLYIHCVVARANTSAEIAFCGPDAKHFKGMS